MELPTATIESIINYLYQVVAGIFTLAFIGSAMGIVDTWLTANPPVQAAAPWYCEIFAYVWAYSNTILAFLLAFLFLGLFIRNVLLRAGAALVPALFFFLLPIPSTQTYDIVLGSVSGLLTYFTHAPVINSLATLFLVICTVIFLWYVFRPGTSVIGQALALLLACAFAAIYIDHIALEPTVESGAVVALVLIAFTLIYLIFYIIVQVIAKAYEIATMRELYQFSLSAVALVFATIYCISYSIYGPIGTAIALIMLVVWSVLKARMGEKAKEVRAADRVIQKIKGL